MVWRSKKLVFHSVLNFRRVTHFQLCLLETKVECLTGFQKALERGNSVPRPKGFCAAANVRFFSVLSHNKKCRNLHVIDTKILVENKIGFY